MYAQIDQILKMLADPNDGRPVILVEFLYQICNSGGGMAEFTELTETYERFQGGYIWDWQDKSLEAKDENGSSFFAYGGDFGEAMTEYECPLFMTNNGIVMPDLTWKPVAYEVRQAYAPVYFVKGPWTGKNQYILKNKYMTKDLSGFKFIADLRENGVITASVESPLENITPQSENRIDVAFPEELFANGKEYHIDLTVYDGAGIQISSNQFLLQPGAPSVTDYNCEAKTPLSLKETGGEYIVAGENFEYIFSKNTGTIVKMTKNGEDYLTGGGEVCLDRPRSGLDPTPVWGGVHDEFEFIQRENIKKEVCASALISAGNSAVIIDIVNKFMIQSGDTIPCGAQYRVAADGTVYVSFYVNATMYPKHLQRAGIEFVLPEGFTELEYHGRGEIENYPDRKSCAKLGVYRSTVADRHFPFNPPSENGGHEDTRRVTLINGGGAALIIQSDRPFHFDAHDYTVAACRHAKHDHEIIRCKETILHIDAAHGPIGGDMAWSTTMPKAFSLKGGYYALNFKMSFGRPKE